MSKIKNGGLDQYGAEPFEQQQFGTAGVKGVNSELCQCSSLQIVAAAVTGTSSCMGCSSFLMQSSLIVVLVTTGAWLRRGIQDPHSSV